MKSKDSAPSSPAYREGFKDGYRKCMEEWIAAEWEYGIGYSRNPEINKKLTQIAKAASNPHDIWD